MLVQDGGKKCHSKQLLLIVRPGETTCSRLGVTITTKVAPRANKRNKLKRWIREIFRHNANRLTANFDIVVIARQNASESTFEELEKQILGTLRYHGFLKQA
jgi:ribonuclease P protein component